jgi:hypothetical protein
VGLVFFLSFSNTAYHQGTTGSTDINLIIYTKYIILVEQALYRSSFPSQAERKNGETADRPDGLEDF